MLQKEAFLGQIDLQAINYTVCSVTAFQTNTQKGAREREREVLLLMAN
jgi:hypothetical protein